MEDQNQKLKALVDLSVEEVKDSFFRDLTHIRSMLQEVVGKMAPTTPQSLFGLRSSMEVKSVKISRFNGDDPAAWVFQVEQYFAHYNIISDHKLSLASLYLDGEALNWYCWLFRNKQLADWDHFVAKLFIRFQSRSREVPDRRLALLQRLATVDYCPAGAATIPSWSTVENLPSYQYLNPHSEYSNLNLAHKMFDEKPDKKTHNVEDAETVEVPDTHVCSTTEHGSISISPAYESDSNAENYEANYIFDKMPQKYSNVDTVDNDCSESNIEIKTLENTETPQVGSVKSVEVAELVQNQVFGELPHTVMRSCTHDVNAIVHEGGHSATMVVKMYHDSFCEYATLQTKVPTMVLDDTKEPNIEEDNVVLFGSSPRRDTSGLLVAWNGQQTVVLNASVRSAETKYPFDGALWIHTVPCLQNSLEGICADKRNWVSFYLDFSLHKRCWVDTGQELNIPGFLLSKSRENAVEEKIWRLLPEFDESYSKQSPDIRFNRVVKLLFAMFRLVHKSTAAWYIYNIPGPFLDSCGAFPPDNVLNHLLVSFCVRTIQHRLPQPLPKPPFSALLLEFLTQVVQSVKIVKELDFDRLVLISGNDSNTNVQLLTAQFSCKLQPVAVVLAAKLQEWKVLELRSENKVMLQEVHPTGYKFYGAIEMVELVARHRLCHGLVAMKRFGGARAFEIIHQYFKVDNLSFDEYKHVKEYCPYHISSASGASFDPSSTLDEIIDMPLSDTNTNILAYYVNISFGREGIDAKKERSEKCINADRVGCICKLLFQSVTNITHVAASNASKFKTTIYGFLSDAIRCFTLVDTSQFITHICHVILYKVVIVQNINKNDEAKFGILRAANKIMILFLKTFYCCSKRFYNTPNCKMESPDMNLEDKVLFEGESIVMNLVQPNIHTKVTQLVIGLTRGIGPRTSNWAGLIWDPG